MSNYKTKIRAFKKSCGIYNVPTSFDIKTMLKALGFKVYGYKDDKDKLIETSMVNVSKQTPAFTYVYKDTKMVFYNDLLNELDISKVLAHELGHIYYDHLVTQKTILDTDVSKEWEANLFALEFLSPISKTVNVLKKMLIVSTVISILFTTIGFSKALDRDTSSYIVTKKTQKNISDYVYITPTGHKYHLSNCIYGENYSHSSIIDLTSAKHSYTPCSLCNPGK